MRAGVWGAAGVLLTVIAWLRLDALTRGTIWAEDGLNFLSGALRGDSIFTPYEGYTHVVPRILADLTVLLVPVPDYAIAMTALTVGVAAGIALLVFGVTAHLQISRGARAGLALITVLAPALISEVSGNAANLHWLFLWLAPWLLLARPSTWVRAGLLGLVAFLAATTEIQMVVFLPLLLVDIRDRRRWPIAAGAVLGAAVQAAAFLSSSRISPTDHPSVLSAARGYAFQVAGGAWLTPISPLTEKIFEHGWWLAYALLAPFVIAAVALLVTTSRLRVLVIALAAGSVACWSAGYLLNVGSWGNFVGQDPDRIRLIGTLRHSVVPSMYLLAIAVLGADRLLASSGAGRATPVWRALGGVLALTLIVTTALSADGRGDSQRSAGPSWRDGVAAARVECRQTDVSEIAIQNAPVLPRWVLTVSCERLLSDG